MPLLCVCQRLPHMCVSQEHRMPRSRRKRRGGIRIYWQIALLFLFYLTSVLRIARMCGRLVSAQSSPTHPPTHPHIRTHMHTPPPPTTYVVPLQTGSPSVNMFIAPDGKVSVTSTHEQLFSAPYVFAGVCFPAQSVCTEDTLLPCSQALTFCVD